MSSPFDHAWAAGFLDGEGYITVAKKNPTYGIRKSGPNVGRPRKDGVTYWLNIMAVQRNPAPIDRLIELYGGSRYYRQRKGKNGYNFWRIGGDAALVALQHMAPFFVGKHQLAATCISFGAWYSATKGENGRSMTDDRRRQAEQYHLECRRLIALHRGPQESTPVVVSMDRGIAGAGAI